MARGGGTGSRNKQKKKSDSTQQNGSNGPAETDKQQINKTTKHRKKEETPPVKEVMEEEVREEKVNKLQPTSEQLRLAILTQDSHLDPQRKGKISQVIDITGKTEDEVATALFDSSWDVQRAVEMLLEEGNDLGSWEETGKKKKKKQEKEDKDGKENEDWDTDNFEPRHDGDNRDKSRGRGPPRFKRGGGIAAGGGRQDGDLWKNKEWQENERNFEGGRGRGGRGMGPRSRGGMPTRQRGRGGGPGRPYGGSTNGGAPGMAPDSGPFGQIDTWNPNGAAEEPSRRGKMSNRDAFENAGNWGDDFPATEEWDNDEYTGSLSDTKVFTPSGSTAKSAVGEPVNQSAAQHSTVSSGASYGQQIDLSTLLQKPGVVPGAASAAPGGPTAASLGPSLTQYNQTATQDLKTAIGIGGPPSGVSKVGDLAPGYSSALSYSSGGNSNNFGSAAPGSAFSPIKPAAVTNGTSGSKALPRARLPPPSKIPSSAVEMPGESLSNLDVQFGGLDLQFGANSEAASSSAGFDFTGGSGGSMGSAPKDLDSKYNSIPVTSTDKPLDSYSAGGPNNGGSVVKDVNQSLNNALSAAGIKPSGGSSDSVGYPVPQRQDSKPTSNFSTQRSPGPGPLDRSSKPAAVTETLGGYSGSGYQGYAPSSNKQQTSQYGQSNPNNYNSNTYDRQNSSSGYSSSNGLSSSSYGGGSGFSSNASPSSNNSNYSVPNNSSSYNNYNNIPATSYSSYSNNSYSSKSNNASAYTSHSQFSSNDPSTSTSTSSSTNAKFDTSVTGSGYPASNNFGLTASSVSSKMSVNSSGGSSKMLPNLPPGVASMIPQYMIGAGAGAGFPAYLAAGLQQPMYGYGGVGAGPQLGGVSGQPLEDLAALQRSTLANLPQLVGSGAAQQTSKGPSNAGYYDPSSQFSSSLSASRGGGAGDSFSDSNKFGGVSSATDSTSSPVPSTAATQQPAPFNALGNLASTFAAAPTQHPTLPPGYAYFYGGMAPQLQAAAYGQTGVYPTAHPGIVPNSAGGTATTQFQKQGYASSYNSYDSLALGQNSSDYGKSNFGSQQAQGKSNSSTAGHWYGGGGNLW